MSTPRILYCNCTYAQIIPKHTKEEVLRGLVDAGVAFEAVADLCEMSAKRDPGLKRLAALEPDEDGAAGELRIAACFPRAVKWLFHAADASLPEEGVEVLNMRDTPADDAVARLCGHAAAATGEANGGDEVE